LTEFDPDNARLEVELVVHDDKGSGVEHEWAAASAPFARPGCLRGSKVALHEGAHSQTRLVHICLGDRQDQIAPGDVDHCGLRVEPLFRAQASRVALGDEPYDLSPGVVTRAFVLNAGIAQPDGDKVGGGQFLAVTALGAVTSDAEVAEQLARSQPSSEAT